MTLNIDYQSHEGFIVRPGSTITGAVNFSSTKDEAISSVTLVLSGRCKVKIREHLHYTTRTFRSRGYYFYEKLELFDGGSFTHKAGDYTWPFSFKVRTHAQRNVVGPAPSRVKKQLDHNGIMQPVEDQSSRDFFPATPPWRGSSDLRPHPIPDTFAVNQTKRSIDLDAKVEYALIARLERPSKGSLLFRSKDIEALIDLTMKSPAEPTTLDALSKMQIVSENKLISQSPVRASSVKAMGWANASLRPKQMNQHQAEQISFSVHYSPAICSSSTVPFLLGAEMSQSVEEPTRTIKATVVDLAISIVGKTCVRDDSQAATEHTAIKLEKETLCWRKEQSNIDLVLRHDPRTGKLMDKVDLEDLVHAPPLVPTFSTFNIAKQYTLEYEIKIRVFGETVTLVTLKESGLAVVVLPAGSDNHTKEWSITIPPADPPEEDKKLIHLSKDAEAAAEKEAGMQGLPPGEEALPAYEP